jgi:hypothetical protein
MAWWAGWTASNPLALTRRLCGRGAPFDLIFANILKGPLIELAPDMAAHLTVGGMAILSGLLVEQADDILEVYRAQGLGPGGARRSWRVERFDPAPDLATRKPKLEMPHCDLCGTLSFV